MQRFTWNWHLRQSVPGLMALVLAVAVIPASQGRATAASGTTFTMSNQTAFAQALSDQPWNGNNPTFGAINTEVGVFQSGAGNSAETMLFYNVYTFESDPTYGFQYIPLASGFGPIPSSAVQVSSGAKPTAVTVNIDTTSLSSSSFQSSGPGGLISLSWTLTPISSFTSSGGTRNTFGYGGENISTLTAGAFYTHSAQATGTVVGYSMPNPGANNDANIGTSQGVSICRGCPPAP